MSFLPPILTSANAPGPYWPDETDSSPPGSPAPTLVAPRHSLAPGNTNGRLEERERKNKTPTKGDSD